MDNGGIIYDNYHRSHTQPVSKLNHKFCSLHLINAASLSFREEPTNVDFQKKTVKEFIEVAISLNWP